MQTKAQKRWKKNHPEAKKAEKKRYREKHKQQIRDYQREWQRNYRIKTRLLGDKLPHSKEFPAPNKRHYPSDCKCEICGVERIRKLNYHHWDDSDFSKGIWVCQSCHNVIHYLMRLRSKLAPQP